MKFRVGKEIKEIPDELIPKASNLGVLGNTQLKTKYEIVTNGDGTESKVYHLTNEEGDPISADEFEVIYDFLTKNILPHSSWFALMSYYNLDPYIDSIVTEVEMRENMYRPEYKNDIMNTEPYYDLIKVDNSYWNNLIKKINSNKNLYSDHMLFAYVHLEPRTMNEIRNLLNKDILGINVENVFVAGGSIFGTLFKAKYKDIDLFIYGLDEEETENKIKEIIKAIRKLRTITGVYRSVNAITIKTTSKYSDVKPVFLEVQIILRLYKTPSEVIHGFDIDSCCMGYDGDNVYMTPRCAYSLSVGYNTINFERLSPSYQYRLLKYARKGMKIYDYEFDRRKVIPVKNEDFFIDLFLDHDSKNKNKVISQYKGVNYLLFGEAYIFNKGNSGWRILIRDSDDISDYNLNIIVEVQVEGIYDGYYSEEEAEDKSEVIENGDGYTLVKPDLSIIRNDKPQHALPHNGDTDSEQENDNEAEEEEIVSERESEEEEAPESEREESNDAASTDEVRREEEDMPKKKLDNSDEFDSDTESTEREEIKRTRRRRVPKKERSSEDESEKETSNDEAASTEGDVERTEDKSEKETSSDESDSDEDVESTDEVRRGEIKKVSLKNKTFIHRTASSSEEEESEVEEPEAEPEEPEPELTPRILTREYRDERMRKKWEDEYTKFKKKYGELPKALLDYIEGLSNSAKSRILDNYKKLIDQNKETFFDKLEIEDYHKLNDTAQKYIDEGYNRRFRKYEFKENMYKMNEDLDYSVKVDHSTNLLDVIHKLYDANVAGKLINMPKSVKDKKTYIDSVIQQTVNLPNTKITERNDKITYINKDSYSTIIDERGEIISREYNKYYSKFHHKDISTFINIYFIASRYETDGTVESSKRPYQNKLQKSVTLEDNQKLVLYFVHYPVNNLYTNSYKSSKFNFIGITNVKYIDEMLRVNPEYYKLLSDKKPVEFPINIEFKITKPGEQMTNTFNVQVLDDPGIWYNGEFYNINNDVNVVRTKKRNEKSNTESEASDAEGREESEGERSETEEREESEASGEEVPEQPEEETEEDTEEEVENSE